MQSSTRVRRSRGKPTQPARPPTTAARSSTCKATLRTRCRHPSWTRATSTIRIFGATRSRDRNGNYERRIEIVTEPVNGGSTAVRLSVGMAQGVWKAFGETQALRDVSLDVGAGECHGLVGRNGAEIGRA